MMVRRLWALCGVAVLLAPLLASAQGAESLSAVDSRSFSRDFGGRSVSCEITARSGGDLTPGKRVVLQVDFDAAISGGADGDFTSTVVLNGLVAVALPPGLEPDGQLRLFYYDEVKGSYQFMYSKDYPELDRLAGVPTGQPAGGDPKQIFAALATLSQALDPSVTPRAPADSRVIGGNASYAVSGTSWLIPCSVFFDELVNPFDPADSLGPGAKVRVNIPLKVTGAVSTPRVAIYAGGLSTAVARAEFLPDKIPATAIPLEPLPEPVAAPTTANPEPPVAEQPPATAEEPRREEPSRPAGRGEAGGNEGGRTPILRPEGQDEETAPPAPPPAPAAGSAAAPAAAPTPIACLIYSYEWVSWETELDLSALAPQESQSQLRFEDNQHDLLPPTVDMLEQTGADNTGEAVEPEAPATTPSAPEIVAAEPEPAELTPQDGTQVREVNPEDIPAGPQTYTVPLKEITGSGAGPAGGSPERSTKPGDITPNADGSLPATISGAPEASYTPPADLGEMVLIPEGYFLMGTGGAASAGDADELPQTKVFLPAYYIDKYPVTNRQFMEFVLRAGYKPDGNWDEYYSPATPDLPVRAVTWNDATAYAKWAGKRLPTEAEWEKAARGEDGRTYPWGEEWSAEILPRGEIISQLITAPKAASPYGVMALVGVLWQWTASPLAPYPFDPNARGDRYVLRGGCYNNGRNIIRCANRYSEPPAVHFNSFTFRCVKDVK